MSEYNKEYKPIIPVFDCYFEERDSGELVFLGYDAPNTDVEKLGAGVENYDEVHRAKSVDVYNMAISGKLLLVPKKKHSIKKTSRIAVIQGIYLAFDSREIQLREMPYSDYLQTPEWQATRKHKLKQASYKCQVCNTNGKTLDVHHRTYERRGNEHDADLIVLCRDCHSTFHNSK